MELTVPSSRPSLESPFVETGRTRFRRWSRHIEGSHRPDLHVSRGPTRHQAPVEVRPRRSMEASFTGVISSPLPHPRLGVVPPGPRVGRWRSLLGCQVGGSVSGLARDLLVVLDLRDRPYWSRCRTYFLSTGTRHRRRRTPPEKQCRRI